MENRKNTIWRVPAAMSLSGIVGRAAGFPLARLFIYQSEDGSYTNSPMYGPCMSIVRLALFLTTGLLRGLDRRSTFRSATIMAAYSFLELAAEQIGQAPAGTRLLFLTYCLCISTGVSSEATSPLFRLTPGVFPRWGLCAAGSPLLLFPISLSGVWTEGHIKHLKWDTLMANPAKGVSPYV